MTEQEKHQAQGAQAAQQAQEAPQAQPIIINTSGYSPKLDPHSPDFDPAAWKAAVDAMGGIDSIGESLRESMAAWQGEILQAGEAIREQMTEHNNTAQAIAEAIRETAQQALNGITEFINSPDFSAFKENMAALAEYMEQNRGRFDELAEAGRAIEGLIPFIEIELAEAQRQDPTLAGCTLEDVLDQIEVDGTINDGPYLGIIERAQQRKAEYEAAEGVIADLEQAAEELPRIISHPAEILAYPLDKPNSRIWNLIEKADTDGQIKLEIDTTGDNNRRKGKEAVIFYSLSFDELEPGVKITKALTPFDKRVYIAAAALYNAGNHVVTATQIYKMMGNRGQPNASDVKKVNDSLSKMRSAIVYLDSTEEVKVNKGYMAFVYDGALLPFEREGAYINNTLADSAIHLFREPPLITFAKGRRQITSIPRRLLESPISKTDANLMIDDYLLERISHMRINPRLPRKILFTTLNERCHITTGTQRSRAPGKVKRFLDHYQAEGFIKGYKMDKDGVTMLF